jgi:hypothetical protein
MKNIFTLLVLLAVLLLNISIAQEPISQADVDVLLGKWTGDIPLGDDLLRLALRFELKDDSKLAALIDMPDRGVEGMPITDIQMKDGAIKFKAAGVQMEFSGKFKGKDNNMMVGTYSQGDKHVQVELRKSAAKSKGLGLSQESMDLLLGKWNGKLEAGMMAIRFEKKRTGDFVGYFDNPDPGKKGIPVTAVKLKDGKLNVKVESIKGEFNGQLSDKKFVGEWKQEGKTSPLSLEK